MNSLWEDILAQPANLRHVVDYLYGQGRENLEAAARMLQNDRPIAMAGIASAAYLCEPACVYLGSRGRYATVVNASSALYFLSPSLGKANVIINSRSGETVEIANLSRLLSKMGIPFIAITNEPHSTVARRAEQVVWSNTRKDDLVSNCGDPAIALHDENLRHHYIWRHVC